jgi:hypothetical protein
MTPLIWLDFLVLDDDILDSDIVGVSREAITSEVPAKKEPDLTFDSVKHLRVEFGPH